MTTTFGGLTLHFESFPISQRPHRTKQTLGKRCTQHEIVEASSNDNVIDIRGYIKESTTALTQTARNNLEDLNDGTKHAYVNSLDSRYDGDYIMETGSLSWEPNINPLFIRYSMRLVTW